jgi:hypothetical protein
MKKIRPLFQPFQQNDDRILSPMMFLVLQHSTRFTFMEKANDAVSLCELGSFQCWNCLVPEAPFLVIFV